MPQGNVDLLREIAVLAGLMYDKSGIAELMKDSDRAIAKLREVATAYNIVSKAAKDYDQREIASETAKVALESKKLTVENKKLALANKEAALFNKDLAQESSKLTIANKKAALSNKALSGEARKLTIESKQLTNEQKRLRLEQQQSRAEKVAQGYKKQGDAAKGLAVNLEGVKDGLIALGVVTAAKGLFDVSRNVERATLRIKNFIDDAQFAALQRRFEQLNKQTDEIFSPSDFEQSAAAVFTIDRNTRRFARSLEFAIQKGPVLGKSLKDIQVGIAGAIVGGETAALEELGLVTQIELENMRRRTGLAFGDLRLAEREKFVFDRLNLTAKELAQADAATKGLNASWGRFLTIGEKIFRTLRKDFEPVMIALLGGFTKFLRMLTASPVGIFVLRMGGLIAAVAALALGIGALTKAFAFLRGMLLLTNASTLLLWGKFILIGSIILAVIILVEDFWLALENPEADTVFKGFFDKYPKVRAALIDLKKLAGQSFTEFDPENQAQLDKVLAQPNPERVEKFKNFFKQIWKDIIADFANGLTGLRQIISDIDDLFKGEYNWSNDALVLEIKAVFDKIGGYADSFFNNIKKLKNFFATGEGGLFQVLPETGGLTDSPSTQSPSISRSDVSSLLDLLGGGLSQIGFNTGNRIGANLGGNQQAPPPVLGSRLFAPAAGAQTSNTTIITIGGSTSSVQAGVDRSEIVELSVDTFRRELEKQLIEADIGGR